MSLYNDLTTVLTPYATKIKKNTADIERLQDDIERLDVGTDETLSIEGKPADAKSVGDALAAAGSVTTNKLADGAVTSAKLGDGAVATDKLANKSVTTAKLDDSSVTQQKLASGAVNTRELADSAVTNVKLADSSISEEKLASSAVTAIKLADGAVTAEKIADGAVTAEKIADGVIPAVDATLTQAGMAADAKAVGDELTDLKSALDLSTPYNAYLNSVLCPDFSQITNGRRIEKNGFTVSMRWVSTNANKLLWFFTGNAPLIVTDFETVASTIPTSDQIVPIDSLKRLPLDLVYYIKSTYEGSTRSQLLIHYLSVSGDEIEAIKVVGFTNSAMTNQRGLNVYTLNVPDGATHFALSHYSTGAGASAIVTLGFERNYSDEIAKLQALALENA